MNLLAVVEPTTPAASITSASVNGACHTLDLPAGSNDECLSDKVIAARPACSIVCNVYKGGSKCVGPY
jgi:hypothetical protein